jgi:hypothetical protein
MEAKEALQAFASVSVPPERLGDLRFPFEAAK